MGFRDPRRLSGSLDNNAFGAPSAPPSATSSPESDQEAGNSVYTGGYVSDNASHLAPAPVEPRESYPSVVYPGGSPNTNRSRG